jgi:ABC-type xylose transport system substrate-binding protein
VRLAHEKGIRVLAYDRLIKNADLDLYATFDNVRVGELQATVCRRSRSGLGREEADRFASTAARPTTTRSSSNKGRTTC